jgi:hypothetical protein
MRMMGPKTTCGVVDEYYRVRLHPDLYVCVSFPAESTGESVIDGGGDSPAAGVAIEYSSFLRGVVGVAA